jgi:hypothetical protein
MKIEKLEDLKVQLIKIKIAVNNKYKNYQIMT